MNVVSSESASYLPNQTMALADAIFPTDERSIRLLRDAGLVIAGVVFVALFAQIRVTLGFTPVPLTGQTLAVLLTGAVLGSRRGAAAMVVYVAMGTWLPIYSGGGSGAFWGSASGGYLIGFILAAYVVGFLAERGWDRKVWIIIAMLLGNIVLYVPGLIQLSYFVPEGKVLEFGLYPFILGDLIKLYLAALALPAAWWVVYKWGSMLPWK